MAVVAVMMAVAVIVGAAGVIVIALVPVIMVVRGMIMAFVPAIMAAGRAMGVMIVGRRFRSVHPILVISHVREFGPRCERILLQLDIAHLSGVHMTSASRGAPSASITSRSKPSAMPLVGGISAKAARKSSSIG